MNRQILTVYIASPFSSTNKAVERFRYNEVTRISAKLYYKYPHAFILPITQSYQLKKHEPRLGGSFARWRDVDLKFISVSDEVWVVMLDGWKDSIGVIAEIEYANKIGKIVRYLNPNTMRFKKQRKVDEAKAVDKRVYTFADTEVTDTCTKLVYRI